VFWSVCLKETWAWLAVSEQCGTHLFLQHPHSVGSRWQRLETEQDCEHRTSHSHRLRKSQGVWLMPCSKNMRILDLPLGKDDKLN
jgi:hypothetical protein